MKLVVERAPDGLYILRYDASLHKLSGCPRRICNRLVYGLSGDMKDPKIEYGTAVHKALNLHYQGHPQQACLDIAIQHLSQPDIYIPDGEWRNIPHAVNCLIQYFDYWKREGELLRPLVVNNKPLLEQRFAYPYLRTARCVVLLCGTMDMVAHHIAFDRHCIVDHKTTAVWEEDSYLASYRLSPQLMIYYIMFRQLFPDLANNIGCVINGIFLRKTNKNVFRRSDMFRFTDEMMIKPFETQLKKRLAETCYAVEKMVDGADKDEAFPPNFLECDSHFGCEFADSCAAGSRADRDSVLESCFTQRMYDPTKHQT